MQAIAQQLDLKMVIIIRIFQQCIAALTQSTSLEIINQPGLILQYGQQQLSASQEMIYTPPPPAHHITHCVLLPLQPQ